MSQAGRKPFRVFINASLSSLAEQRLNTEIAAIVEEAGLCVYLPQRELPLGAKASPGDILEANSIAVANCDVVLSVLDKPGLGVAFELGLAFALKKCIVLFRTDTQDYLGKVIEGLWASQTEARRASTIEELRSLIARLS